MVDHDSLNQPNDAQSALRVAWVARDRGESSGGLSTREVLEIIHNLPYPLTGADIVELNPDRDLHGMTAMIAAKLLKEIVAQMLSG